MPETKKIQVIPMPTDNKAKLLDETSWAKDFTWEEIVKFVEFMKAYFVIKDDLVFLEGDPGNEFFVIVQGRVTVEKMHKNKPVVVALLSEGQAIGELSLVDHEPRSATIRATVETRLLGLDRSALQQLTEKYPYLVNKLLIKILRMLGQRLRRTSSQFVDSIA